MDNFKFNFLSRGQLESLILDEFLLTSFKTITCHEVFSGNLIFAIIARILCGNHLNINLILEGAVASWLVHSTPERVLGFEPWPRT